MMDAELCLDANIFVSAMVPTEQHYSESSELIELIRRKDLVLREPPNLQAEFISVIHRKTQNQEIPENRKNNLFDLFFDLPILIQWRSKVLKDSSDIAKDLNYKLIYDCLYLAVAARYDIPLITHDQELRKRGRSFFRKIYTVSEYLKDSKEVV
ncbi:MAG: type II toxin-antitoxin system VapC family toxin [bacterium]|nr:type II toxin-antitoxin system VapC family toxin [bacterium]